MLGCNSTVVKSFLNNCTHPNSDDACWSLCHQLLCMTLSFPAAVVVSLLGLYLLLAVLTYEWQRRNEQVEPVNRLYIVPVFCCSAFCFIALMSMKAQQWDCRFIRVFGTFFYAASILLVYTVIWLRQRQFYVNPLLNESRSVFCQILNVAVITGIYVFLLTNTLASAYSFHMESTIYGCATVYVKNKFFKQFLMPLITSTLVLDGAFQLILLALTLYPLISNPNNLCRCCASEKCQNNFDTITDDIRGMMTKLAFCTAVCIAATVGFGYLLYRSINGGICFFWILCLEFHLIILNFTLVYSFSNGLFRLLPVERIWSCKKNT